MLVNNDNTFYTGGFVRDLILQNPQFLFKISNSLYKFSQDFLSFSKAQDIDLATSLTPNEIAKVIDINFPNSNRMRKFATNAFEVDGKKIEITSTRIDKNCDGRHAQMNFGASFYKDSFRRDFTFNALYMRQDGLIFDFHNGIKHLQNKEIHFIGDIQTRIHEDYTRIKRYYNFAERFKMRNLEIEKAIDYIMKNSTKPIIMR